MVSPLLRFASEGMDRAGRQVWANLGLDPFNNFSSLQAIGCLVVQYVALEILARCVRINKGDYWRYGLYK